MIVLTPKCHPPHIMMRTLQRRLRVHGHQGKSAMKTAVEDLDPCAEAPDGASAGCFQCPCEFKMFNVDC
jgi:hypothetical protein